MRTSIVFFLIHRTVARKLFPLIVGRMPKQQNAAVGVNVIRTPHIQIECRRELFFIRFPKPGKLRDNMSLWEKNQAKNKTEKAKRWQFLPVWAQGFSKARKYLERDIYLLFAF